MKTNINKKLLISILIASFIFTACKNSENEDNESKLKKLEEYRSELNELKSKIADLEKELENSDSDSEDNHTSGVPAKTVTTQKIKKSVFTHHVKVYGKVHSRENVMINAEVSANVNEILLREGAKVSQGQILIRLDADLIQKNIAEIESSLSFANDIYNRRKSLWDQKIGSEIQYLQAKNDKERLENNLQSARAQYEKTRIRAPISGFIDEIFINRGELANPGQPVLRIVNLEKVSVRADISERYIGKLKAGDSVQVHFPVLDKTLKSTVAHIGSTIHPGNRTFSIEVNLPNKDTRLKPNLLASVFFTDYRNDSAIVVPVNIVQHDREGSYVYIVNKGKARAQKQLIKTGLTYDGKTEVSEGLKEGDEIVILGFNEVSHGSPLVIQK